MVLWAVAFPPLLQQQESKVARRLECLDAEKREVNRAECCFSLVTSVITGDRCSCVRDGSGTEVRDQRVITARMLVVAFTVMICSLNLRGYIHAPGSLDAEGLETGLASPFPFPFFAQWQRMDRFWTRRALEIPSSVVTLLLLLSFCMCWSSVSSMPSTRALLSDWQGGRITARRATTKIRWSSSASSSKPSTPTLCSSTSGSSCGIRFYFASSWCRSTRQTPSGGFCWRL